MTTCAASKATEARISTVRPYSNDRRQHSRKKNLVIGYLVYSCQVGAIVL